MQQLFASGALSGPQKAPATPAARKAAAANPSLPVAPWVAASGAQKPSAPKQQQPSCTAGSACPAGTTCDRQTGRCCGKRGGCCFPNHFCAGEW
jgi:hypothetical protein